MKPNRAIAPPDTYIGMAGVSEVGLSCCCCTCLRQRPTAVQSLTGLGIVSRVQWAKVLLCPELAWCACKLLGLLQTVCHRSHQGAHASGFSSKAHHYASFTLPCLLDKCTCV